MNKYLIILLLLLIIPVSVNAGLYQNRCWQLSNGTVCINGTSGVNTFTGVKINASDVLNLNINQSVSYQSNVKDYGAIGNGTSDDTMAIQAALDASTNVYFPAGNYLVSNLNITNNNTHVFGDGTASIITFKTGATGIMLNAGLTNTVFVEKLKLVGGTIIDYRSNATQGNNRSGLSLSANKNSFVKSLVIEGFENTGLFINNNESTAILERFTVSDITVAGSWIGVDTGLDGESYTRWYALNLYYNRYGIIAGEGNVLLVDSTIVKNYYGYYMDGDRLNDGHGIVSNSLINHNTNPIYAKNIGFGHTFIGNQIFEGNITFDNCTGITITSGTIDATNYVFTNGGINRIINNHIRTNYGSTISHSADSTVFENNYKDDSTFLENVSYAKLRTSNQWLGIGNTNPEYSIDLTTGDITDTSSIRLGVKNVAGNGGGVVWNSGYVDNNKVSASIMQVAEGSYFRSGIAFYTDDSSNYNTNATEKMRLTMDGDLGIGTSTPISSFNGVDISSGGLSLIVGADASASTRTTSTNKAGRIGAVHYNISEEPTALLLSSNTLTTNSLNIGGGSSLLNTMTVLSFYTAPNTTTTTGTERMRIDSSGNVGIGTIAPRQKLEVNGSGNFSGTDAQLWVNGSLVCTVSNGLCSGNTSGDGAAGWYNDSTNVYSPYSVQIGSNASLNGYQFANRYFVIDGPDETKSFTFAQDGVPIVDGWDTYGGENAAFLYGGYWYANQATALVIAESNRIGVNKDGNYMDVGITGVSFRGTGLNDLSVTGSSYDKEYSTEYIVSMNTTNSFRYKTSIMGGAFSDWSSPILVTTPTTLDGILLNFGSTTGYTIGDEWFFIGQTQRPPATFSISPIGYRYVLSTKDNGATFIDNTMTAASANTVDTNTVIDDGIINASTYLYLGSGVRQNNIYVDLNQGGDNITLEVQYPTSDGNWVTLDDSNLLDDQTFNLSQTGGIFYSMGTMSDWNKSVTVDGITGIYWLRLHSSSISNMTPLINGINPNADNRLCILAHPQDTICTFYVNPKGDLRVNNIIAGAEYSNEVYAGEVLDESFILHTVDKENVGLVLSNVDSFSQFRFKNMNHGTASSSSIIIENDRNYSEDYFAELGCNGQNYATGTGPYDYPDNCFLNSQASDLVLTTGDSSKKIVFGVGHGSPIMELNSAGLYIQNSQVCTAANGLCTSGITPDNTSWNQTYANTLYYDISNPLGFYNSSTMPYQSSAAGWSNTTQVTTTGHNVNISDGNFTVALDGADYLQILPGSSATAIKATGGYIALQSGSSTNGIVIQSQASSANYAQVGATANYAYFGFKNNIGTDGLSVNATGVGIGVVNPTQKLDVNGSANFSGTNAIVYINGSIACTAQNGLCATAGGNATFNQTLTDSLYQAKLVGNSFQCAGTDQLYNVSISSSGVISGLCSAQGSGGGIQLSDVAANMGNWSADKSTYTANDSAQQTSIANLQTANSTLNTSVANLITNASNQQLQINSMVNLTLAQVNTNMGNYSANTAGYITLTSAATGLQNTTIARTGTATCGVGLVAQNVTTTTSGITSQCVAVSASITGGNCAAGYVVQNISTTGVPSCVLDQTSAGAGVNGTPINITTLIIDNNGFNNTLTMRAMSTDAVVPQTGFATMSVKTQGGRSMFRATGPSGLDYNFQPSMYQQSIMMIMPGATTAVSQFGTTTAVSSVGTLSTPAVTSTYGRRTYVNNATGVVPFNISIMSGDTAWLRGQNNTPSAGASGWYTFNRINIENATTQYVGVLGNSTIIFVGMTSGTGISMVVNASTLPAGSYAGFYYSNMTLQTASNNWTFITSNGTVPSGITVYNTTIPFRGGTVVDFYQYCKAGCSTIGFRVADQITGDYYEGATDGVTTRLPVNSTLLRAGWVMGVPRLPPVIGIGLGAQKQYVETDR